MSISESSKTSNMYELFVSTYYIWLIIVKAYEINNKEIKDYKYITHRIKKVYIPFDAIKYFENTSI